MKHSAVPFFVLAIIAIISHAQSPPKPNPEDMKRYWQPLLPDLPGILKLAFPDCCVEPVNSPTWNGYYPVRIVQTADVTGDGVPEALVYLGQGGASTDYITVMRIEADKPVVALFKEASGKMSPQVFLRGASATHGDTTDFLPDQRAVYWMSTTTDQNGMANTCTVTAYQWNAQEHVFRLNKLLGKQIAAAHCPKRGTPSGS